MVLDRFSRTLLPLGYSCFQQAWARQAPPRLPSAACGTFGRLYYVRFLRRFLVRYPCASRCRRAADRSGAPSDNGFIEPGSFYPFLPRNAARERFGSIDYSIEQTDFREIPMCPFQVGDWIRYTPTQRGRGHLVMTGLANLIPNELYRVAEVVENDYVVLESHESAMPNAIYWTEFARETKGRN